MKKRPSLLSGPARVVLLVIAFAPLTGANQRSLGDDVIRDFQEHAVKSKDEKLARPWHFGSQGPNNVYSNSTGHSNRLIPYYVFGKPPDLSSVTGANSAYRSSDKLKALFGAVPPNTLNPEAEYCDQSDFAKIQRDAVGRGAKHIFIVWFDGMDWEPTRAAAIARTGDVYTEGKGHGLLFQDYTAAGTAQYGFYVTSPTHDQSSRDVNAQTVVINRELSLPGGYDFEIAGKTPWSVGPLFSRAPGYLKGNSVNLADALGVLRLRRTLHAATDSAPSAAEFASGVKSYNDSVNVAPDGRFVSTVFRELQSDRDWRVGTVTSVPISHVSPAAMYARNVDRDDYQDLTREMLGLESIVQQTGKAPRSPGLDVVIGTGFGQDATESSLKAQGANAVPGNKFLTADDRKAIDVNNGGRYVVAETTANVKGADVLMQAANRAAASDQRLLGFFGSRTYGTNERHLPYRTADGDYQPAPGLRVAAEHYSDADRLENPTLAEMTRAALAVLGARKDRPFALFVESGDVDWALHDNNLDNAIGAIYSGEDAIREIIDWVERNSNWNESVLIVSADHGHYLVLDDPSAIAGKAK